jgi:hypothetical protein
MFDGRGRAAALFAAHFVSDPSRDHESRTAAAFFVRPAGRDIMDTQAYSTKTVHNTGWWLRSQSATMRFLALQPLR